MGTTLLGDNYLAWVPNTAGTSFNYIAGQGKLTVTRSPAEIDISSKTDGAIAASMPGRRKVSAALALKPQLPDVSGYGRLETLAQAYPKVPFEFQIRKGGTGGAAGDIIFDAMVYANIDSTDFDQDQAVSASITLTCVSVTTDALA